MTLFASIFAFVSTFPSPPAQNSNQFQASLAVSSDGKYVTGINITHLAGPTVPTSAQIYFKSAGHPAVCPFTNPISVSPGISGNAWTLGQTWGVPFASICGTSGSASWDPLPDNITVYVVNNANLLFSVILPGSQIVTPPQILSTWTFPSPVPKGSAFSVDATIAGTFLSNSVYLNLANVPGLPTTPVQMAPYQGHWVWNSTGNSTGPTMAGSYTGFINVSGPNGASVYGTVAITVISNAGGIIVSITAIPTSGVVPLHVSFAASVSGANGSLSYAWDFGDLEGNTSTSPAPTDWYNTSGSYLVSLTVTDSTGNQGSATQIITAKLANHVQAITWSTRTTVTYGCSGSWSGYNCPDLDWRAWNNGTYGVVVSGTEYANGSGTNDWSSPIGSTTIAANSNTGTVLAFTLHPRNSPDTFKITLVLTVTVQSSSAFVATISYTWAQTVTITG